MLSSKTGFNSHKKCFFGSITPKNFAFAESCIIARGRGRAFNKY